MGKLKRYQLLEKAMRDYPKGTNFTWGELAPVFTSTGVFYLKDHGIWTDDRRLVMDSSEKWAEIVKPSILDGKVAIQVNNERELKMLMEHYEGKGWKSQLNMCPLEVLRLFIENKSYIRFDTWLYGDKFHGMISNEYTVIPFSEFASEVGIAAPKFIMKSEDGVDLYNGDPFHEAYLQDGKWQYVHGDNHFVVSKIRPVTIPDESKAFSTKEAAKAWIAEKNKPKYKEVELFNGMIAKVYTGEILINDGKRTATTLMPSELEDLINAYKSLNGKETDNG